MSLGGGRLPELPWGPGLPAQEVPSLPSVSRGLQRRWEHGRSQREGRHTPISTHSWDAGSLGRTPTASPVSPQAQDAASRPAGSSQCTPDTDKKENVPCVLKRAGPSRAAGQGRQHTGSAELQQAKPGRTQGTAGSVASLRVHFLVIPGSSKED